jgi:hypothetical protein
MRGRFNSPGAGNAWPGRFEHMVASYTSGTLHEGCANGQSSYANVTRICLPSRHIFLPTEVLKEHNLLELWQECFQQSFQLKSAN